MSSPDLGVPASPDSAPEVKTLLASCSMCDWVDSGTQPSTQQASIVQGILFEISHTQADPMCPGIVSIACE